MLAVPCVWGDFFLLVALSGGPAKRFSIHKWGKKFFPGNIFVLSAPLTDDFFYFLFFDEGLKRSSTKNRNSVNRKNIYDNDEFGEIFSLLTSFDGKFVVDLRIASSWFGVEGETFVDSIKMLTINSDFGNINQWDLWARFIRMKDEFACGKKLSEGCVINIWQNHI